jgi:signal transduction histidine kinase
MKFLKKDEKIRNGYLTAFLFFILTYIFSFFIALQMERVSRQVIRTNETMNKLTLLNTSLADLVTGGRGYTLSNDEYFSKLLQLAYNNTNTLIYSIRNLIGPDTLQQHRLDIIQNNVKENYYRIYLGNDSALEDSKNQSATGFRLMLKTDDDRKIIKDMQRHESQTLGKKTSKFKQVAGILKVFTISSFLLAILLSIYTYIIFNKENEAKKLYRAELESGIEKLKEANIELEQIKTIEKLALSERISRTLAHEIRNPLTNISLAVEQLKDIREGDKDKHLLLDIINRNAKRINELISELLNSTKFKELNINRNNINKVLDDTLELAKDTIELNGTKIIKHYSTHIPDVEIDPAKVKIAFLNIIVNGIEATEPNKGIIEITTESKYGKCLVIIKDNGVGMVKENLSRIFEPYYTNKKNGNGFGLTNTQNIIISHKGSINVESTPGKGTRFVIGFNYLMQNSAEYQNGKISTIIESKKG